MRGELDNCYAMGVEDIDAAAAFYERVLGYRRKMTTSRYIEIDSGVCRLFLCNEEVEAPTFRMLVEDIGEAEDYLTANGFQRSPEDVSEVTLRDPFGHVYCLVEG